MSGFSITEVPVAAGLLGLCPLPATPEAVAQLLAWHPALVLSLTEAEEMAGLGAAGLPQALAQAGIGWRHLPITDYDVPHPSAETLPLLAEISYSLASGGRVVVHCRGGCGRTGMIALRLMLDAGEAAGPALLRLRSLRPCAIETDAQLRWATSP